MVWDRARASEVMSPEEGVPGVRRPHSAIAAAALPVIRDQARA